ncbi:glycosyltransferase [Paenibacillus sp. 1P03SA]|uniref:glycosyltransferase n=1 Tax=Paenibacillus sp. 1P03SA TaxID=3132294 RepID=UPI0039A03914
MKQPISACIMTKNEQDTIGNCVDSIRPYVEEIIVLDTGSEDATADIALSKGAAVYRTVWQNDFSRVRNELIQLAAKPIVFMIDADEIAVPRQEKAFEKIGKQLLSDVSLVAKINILNEIDDGISSATISRVFNKESGLFFKGVVHEQIECSTKELKFIQSDIVLRHTGYLSSQIIGNNKYERNLTLLFKELEKNNKNSYIHFQIGRTYSASGDYEKAVYHLSLAYKLSNTDHAYYSALIQTYGWALLRTNKFSELFEVLQTGLQLYPDYTDLYFLYGCTLVQLKSD